MKNLFTLLIIIFLTGTVSAQLPIQYYAFEVPSGNYSSFTNYPTYKINSISTDSAFKRNSGNTIFSTNSYGISVYGGIRNTKAIYSPGWELSLTDPGVTATKYYQFPVNTSGLSGINLNFLIWAGTTGQWASDSLRLGILYSTNNGTSFTKFVNLSLNTSYLWIVNVYLNSVTELNNNPNVIFRIYAYGATSSNAYVCIDNMLVTALGTTASANINLLSEPLIYKSYTGGSNGVWVRNKFNIKSGTTVTLTDWMATQDTITVNGTLYCPNVNTFIYDYNSKSVFNLNPDATLIIGDPDGISSSGTTGPINTFIRNFSTDANYIYKTSMSMFSGHKPTETLPVKTDFIETTANYDPEKANVPPTIKGVEKPVKDASTPVTGTGLPPTVNSLTVDNTNNLQLTNDLTINSSLALINGIFDVLTKNLTLAPAATVSGTFSSSRMVAVNNGGEFRKRFNPSYTSFTFPVGDNNQTANYSPVTLIFTSASYTNAYVGVKVVEAKHPDNLSVNNYLKRYWTLTPSGITNFTYNVDFVYNDADVVGDENNIYGGKYDAGTWILMTTANPSTNSLHGEGLTSFSSYTGGEQGAMPVELLLFTARANAKSAILSWATGMEMNNAGFEIYRSNTNENNWMKVGFVPGKGNSNVRVDYSFEDKNLMPGKYLYQLKQVDYNGTSTTYLLNTFIEITVPKKLTLSQNYPNPFNPVTKIDYNLPTDAKISMKIYDLSGREIYSLVNTFQKAGTYTVTFDGTNLATGIYLYSLVVESNGKIESFTKKMTLIK
ncbi:MAG: T9SS type A sorting domain-containing protein [Ignavibacteria bacterium]